jgi:hypothetical protein
VTQLSFIKLEEKENEFVEVRSASFLEASSTICNHKEKPKA